MSSTPTALALRRWCALAALLALPVHAAEKTDPVQAVWQPVEIRYSYVGFTTAYNCDAFEDKMERILQRLGAPAQTQVQANGCIGMSEPSRNFFVTITTATPVPESEAKAIENKSRQELIERLNQDKKRLNAEPFPAAWQTIDLANDRRLNLEPGDCELMEDLRDEVLPKLSVKVLSKKIQCTPRQLGITTPELQVSALVPLPKADDASANERR